jgi:hypothetical protein
VLAHGLRTVAEHAWAVAARPQRNRPTQVNRLVARSKWGGLGILAASASSVLQRKPEVSRPRPSLLTIRAKSASRNNCWLAVQPRPGTAESRPRRPRPVV